MTREVYNMLSQVLDNIEEELNIKKTSGTVETEVTEDKQVEQSDMPVPTVHLKIDMNIHIV